MIEIEPLIVVIHCDFLVSEIFYIRGAMLCFLFYFSLALLSIPRCLPLFYLFGTQRLTV